MIESGPHWPYSARNGMNVAEDLDVLLGEPAVRLTEAERQQVDDFQRALFNGQFPNGPRIEGVEKVKSLLSVENIPLAGTENEVFLDYLSSDAAAEDIDLLAGADKSPAEMVQTVYDQVAEEGKVAPKTYKGLAERSEAWYKAEIAGKLQNPEALEQADAQMGHEVMNINCEPDKLLEKVRYIQAFRTFYRNIAKDMRTQELADGVRNAQQVYVALHMSRANNMMALQYPKLMHLVRQLELSPDTEHTRRWSSELAALVPAIRIGMQEDTKSRFINRLDLVRNGAGEDYDDAGYATPISRPASRLVEVVERRPPAENTPKIPDGWTEEEVAATRDKVWTAADTKELLDTVIDEWGLLSDKEIEWDEYVARKGPAEDRKWQTVIWEGEKKTGVKTETKKKGMLVGQHYERTSLQINPAGTLAVTAHELAHLLQGEAGDAFAETIPLARLGGRRRLAMAELGGIIFESEAFAEFGLDRGVNTTYYRALEAKRAGASPLMAANAYYASRMRTPGVNPDKARTAAADGTLRLYRWAGVNSQPLDYLEQDLMEKEMQQRLPQEQIAAMAIYATAFSLPDLARLHAAGVLDMPKAPPRDPAQDVLRVYRKHFMNRK